MLISKKNKIESRTDINIYEKTILKNEVDFLREKQKSISKITFSTQVVILLILVIQIFLLVVILLMPKKSKQYK